MGWRLGWAVLCACSALLTVFPAPAYPFWFLALGVTEWSPIFALLCLAPLAPGWRRSPQGRAAAALAAFAFAMAWTPWLRAFLVARSLPGELAAAFGQAEQAAAGTFLVRRETRAYAPNLSMDIYRPEGAAARLAVLVVHGGSWRSGERGDFVSWNERLAGRGYVVADVDYRLAPDHPFPAGLKDVRAAISYLKKNVTELRRIILLGRSAGGQLALLAAYDRPDPSVCGVIAFYTPNDLVFAYSKPSNPLIMDSKGVLEAYMGGPPEKHPGLYEKASPLDFVGTGTPPTLLIHGLRDELVWKDHSERLDKKLAAAGRPHFYLRLPWATHGCDYNLSGPCGRLSLFAVERFLSALDR